MGSFRIALVVTLMFATGSHVRADCAVVNGSFESHGLVDNIYVRGLDGWDVQLPEGMFSGRIVTAWSTDGPHSLMLSANWLVTFAGGELGTVSQVILLNDVDRIVFDLKLETSGSGWDPAACTAVVLVDNDVVWESNFDRADIRGEYRDQAYVVDDKYRDGQLHRLAFGLRVNAGGMFWTTYTGYWDSIRCASRACSGGPWTGDFNRDCVVDVDDLMMMAGQWLTEVPLDSPYNLSTTVDENSRGAGTVNFLDWAAFSSNWLAGGVVQGQ